MTEKHWKSFLRLASVSVAIAMWTLSVFFSVDGFNFIVPRMAWAGVVLALCVTVIELVFNEEGAKHTTTIFIAGIAAYVYGVVTNVVGILIARNNAVNDYVGITFAILLGVLLEIIPEPLVLWGLLGKSPRDILQHLFANEA